MHLEYGLPVSPAPIERSRGKDPLLLTVFFALFFVAAPLRAALMPVTTDVLNEQRAKWALSGIASYIYEGSAECFCLPDFVAPHRVTVANGVVTELLFADTLLPDANPGSQYAYLPVEDFFDLLQARIDNNWVRVEAMFDPTLGYPLQFYTDFSEQLADEEYGFRIHSLFPVTVPSPGTLPLLLLSLAGVHGFRRRYLDIWGQSKN
ncbi:MAG: hypothetical protein KDI33_10870 [Halioglobus sp.]|nr:hypothetical protein [Halioglobus sp.]